MDVSRGRCVRMRATMSQRSFRPAFTIIELTLVLAIFAITAATTLPFLGRFQQRETFQTITEDIVRTLQTAQHKAMSGERDSSWGVRFERGAYILYAGTSYTARRKPFDRRHAAPRTLTFTGTDDVNFHRESGEPRSGSGFLSITIPDTPSASVTINAAGGIFLEQAK